MRALVSLLFALLPMATMATSQTHPAFFATYRGERAPLRFDPRRVAMRAHEAPIPASSEGQAIVRLDFSGAHEHVSGWWLVPLERPFASGLDARRTVAQIARETGAFVSPVFLDSAGAPQFVTDDLFVGVRQKLPAPVRAFVAARYAPGTLVERDFARMKGVYRYDPATNDGFAVLDMANAIAEDPDVAFAEPGWLANGRGEWSPNDPEYPNQWALNNTGQYGASALVGFDLRAELAWDVTLGSPDVRILVLDVGVDPNHPDIRQLPGVDFTQESAPIPGGPLRSWENHGTSVAGVITAIADNGVGIAGIAPMANLVSARVYTGNADGTFTFFTADVAEALAWGVANGCRVSNNSNTYRNTSGLIDEAYRTARDEGMIHFAATGWSGGSIVGYPARLPTVNALGGTMWNGARDSQNDAGPDLDLLAPGWDVLTTDVAGPGGYNAGDYAYVRGTSFASAYAAGVAALLKVAFSGQSVDQLETRLRLTARDMGPVGVDKDHGWGMVDAHQALAGAPPEGLVVAGRFSDGRTAVTSRTIRLSTPSALGSLQQVENAAILDDATIDSTIEWPHVGTVLNVSVAVNVLHGSISDLSMWLVGPDGTSVLLHDRGAGGPNIQGTYPTTLTPVAPLESFQTKRSSGPWRLFIRDHAPGDTGTLVQWALTIQSAGILRSMSTNSDGWYSFTGLPRGGPYTVQPMSWPAGRVVAPATRTLQLMESVYHADFGLRPNFTDLGVIQGPSVTSAQGVLSGQVRWLRFETPHATSGARFLDIDTEGTTATTSDPDTVLALYDSQGLLLVVDDEDGSGRLSQISFGPHAPQRPPFPGAWPYDGRNGVLPAGQYYLGLTVGRAIFRDGFYVIPGSSTGVSARVNFGSNFGGRFVSGTLDLGPFAPGPAGQIVQIGFRDANGTTVGATSARLDAQGGYEAHVPYSLTGSVYDVRFRPMDLRWLGRLVPGVTLTASGATGVDTTLVIGNVDDDNAIDLSDFLILAANYEMPAPSDPRADINGDGAVNFDDFLILAGAYDTVGDD